MADDVLILIDQQKAMEHPKWGPRNNLDTERNIALLLITFCGSPRRCPAKP